jgi:cytochrome c oxidase subunit II
MTAACAALVGGCGSQQSTLAPRSEPARSIDSLWWKMMIGGWAALAVIVGLLTVVYLRRRRAAGPGGERAGWAVVLTTGLALPILVVGTLFVAADIFLIKTTQAPAAGSTQMTVRVIGHQWWWEFRFPGRGAVTANELHIPVRTRIQLVATTDDVIHSFWVPQLNRKIDTIPGQDNRILLEADRPGRYRGQCAEFCGLQHTHMGVMVIAQPRAQFDAWLARQAEPARAPATAEERRGRQVFMSGPCSSCHQIRGTSAQARVGPDLTHVGGRETLAALTIPNTPDQMASWIRGNQTIKPGNQMPDVALAAPDLRAVVAYLESLR